MSAENAGRFEVIDPDPIRRVELAMEDLRAGRMVILTDDEDRENEGDLVFAAEKVTPELINFMASEGRGLICLSITSRQVERLGLPMMATNNQSAYNTAFTVSIEAREGVTTGISAADRAHTVRVAIDPAATPRSVVVPGHVFPLRARDGGVLERVGQTEGSVDLCRLGGLQPAAVICEIMNPDGTMARMSDLVAFGERHRVRLVAVADVIKYRMRNERVVERLSAGVIEIPGLGTWTAHLYRSVNDRRVHLAVSRGNIDESPTLVRVQPAPPAWSILAPDASKLAVGARRALEKVHAEGAGALVLLHLDGRSAAAIGVEFDRDFGGDASHVPMARADALRELGTGCRILRDLGYRDLRLLVNSNRPLVGLDAYGLRIAERVALL